MAKYTKQTPEVICKKLAATYLIFGEDLTLDQVAEECRTHYLAGRLSEHAASKAIVAWATFKLATHREFSADHWEWLVALDDYDMANGYSRLLTILRPAVSALPNWRQTDAERSGHVDELIEAAETIRRSIVASLRLNVGLREVVGLNPGMQPLLDHSHDLQTQQMEVGRKRAKLAKKAGASTMEIVAASLPLDGYVEPHLLDYLDTFVELLKGSVAYARPTQHKVLLKDFEEGIEPAALQELMERFGFAPKNVAPVQMMRTGGDFGSYPTQKKALRRAVILAFPQAIFSRFTAPPKATPSSLIEAACIAWFGDSPSQKEINNLTQADRQRLLPEMEVRVSDYGRAQEIEAAWKAAGLTEEEIRRKRLLSFLDADEEPHVRGKKPSRVSRVAQGASKPPKTSGRKRGPKLV